MTTYEVTAWCSVPYYTTFEIEAGSITEALEKAKRQALGECGEPCGGGESEWDEFEITSDNESLSHVESSGLAANAGLELRDALQHGTIIARRLVDSWEQGDLAETVRALSQWLAASRAVLSTATEQEETQPS